MGSFFAALLLATVAVLSSESASGAEPEPPRAYLDTTYVPPTGRTISVSRGGNFQAALNSAQPGDVITLDAGATFVGPFTLPKKSGTGWITVRSSTADSNLPPRGTRVTPAYTKVMPKIVSPNSAPALRTAPGAHHFRFIAIEVKPAPGVFVYNLIQLGADESGETALPHHLIFDRCYIHGDPVKGGRRGIALNSKSVAIVDSHFSDFKEVGADSQAIAGWNGPGPFKIVNNYLEGAGENVMFGGADPAIPDLVPSDIEIRGNHFAKPLSWRIGDPTYAGTPWTVKNLFELKNARRVLIEGNVFERNWAHAQSGFAILFTVRNQSGTAPWSVVEDVTFARNVVRDAARGINILGRDTTWPSGSQPTRRIRIAGNLFLLDAGRWGGGCCAGLFQLLEGTADVAIEHNTAVHTGNVITAEGAAHTGFVFRDNIAPHNAYGVIGSDYGVGHATLARYFPGAVFERNVLAGGNPALYPRGNFFPRSLDEVGFVDRSRGDYRLAPSSPYRGAGTGGRDIGADMNVSRLSGILASPRH